MKCNGRLVSACLYKERETGRQKDLGEGGGVLPMTAYMGRLRPKGESFSGFRNIKG